MAALVNGNQQRQANQPTHLVCLDVFRCARTHTHNVCLTFERVISPTTRTDTGLTTWRLRQPKDAVYQLKRQQTTRLLPSGSHQILHTASSSLFPPLSGGTPSPLEGSLSLRPGPPGRITESAYQRTRANIFSIEKKIPPLVSSFFALQFFFFEKEIKLKALTCVKRWSRR